MGWLCMCIVLYMCTHGTMAPMIGPAIADDDFLHDLDEWSGHGVIDALHSAHRGATCRLRLVDLQPKRTDHRICPPALSITEQPADQEGTKGPSKDSRAEASREQPSRPSMEKKVQCYMDIKIGPRFAGRMVFEVRFWLGFVCEGGDRRTGHHEPHPTRAHSNTTAVHGLHPADGGKFSSAMYRRAVRCVVCACLYGTRGPQA